MLIATAANDGDFTVPKWHWEFCHALQRQLVMVVVYIVELHIGANDAGWLAPPNLSKHDDPRAVDHLGSCLPRLWPMLSQSSHS